MTMRVLFCLECVMPTMVREEEEHFICEYCETETFNKIIKEEELVEDENDV